MLTVKDNRVYVGPDLVGTFSSPEAADQALQYFGGARNVLMEVLDWFAYRHMIDLIACLPPGPRAHREAP